MASSGQPPGTRLTARSVDLLVELLDQPEPVLSGSALSDFLSADAAPLIEAGLLKQSGHSATATSAEGDDAPIALVWDEDRPGYFSPSGWVDADKSRLARYVADVDALCRLLLPHQKNMHIKELVSGLLWDLGTVRLPHRTHRVPLVLARRVFDRASWQVIRQRLVDRPQENRVVIIAGARRNAPDAIPVGNRAAVLGDIVEDAGLALNFDTLAAILDGRPLVDPDDSVVVVGDGREVRLYGRTFRFPKGEQQRRIIRAIHRRYLDGQQLTSWAELAEELNLGDRSRLRDYFKDEKQPVIGRLLFEGGGLVGFCLRD